MGPPRLGGAGPRAQALRRRRDPALGDQPDRARAAGPRPGRATELEDAVAELLACFAGLPLLPAGRAAPTSTRRSPHARETPARPGGRPSTRSSPSWAIPTSRRRCRFQQTSGMVMAKGVEDCAFYRSSRLTSLNEVGADPGVFSITPADVPRGDDRAAARVAARDDHALHPRHQARGGRPRQDHRARRAVRRCGQQTLDELPARWSRSPTPASEPCCGRRSSAPGPQRSTASRRRTCGTGCTPTPRRRCARRVTTPRGPTPTVPTRRPCTQPSTQPSTTSARAPCSPISSSRSPRPAGATRWPPSSSRSPLPVCPTSTRAASCGSRASSTPTTAGPSTSPTASHCSNRRGTPPGRPLGRRPSTTVAPPSSGSPPGHSVGAATPPSCSRATRLSTRRGPPPTTCWPSTAAARSPLPPGSRWGWLRRAAGATRRSTLPPGTWRDALSEPSRPLSTTVRLADLLADLPVALLTKED